jgi:anti-sigma factor RsiW
VSASTSHLDDLISAYVDGQLSGVERSVVDAHLASCPACRAEVAATEQAKAWVSQLPPADPPFGFYERMLRDGAGPSPRHPRWVMRLGAVSLAATASVWFGVVGFGTLDANRPGGMPALGSLFNLHSEAKAVVEPTDRSVEPRAAAFGLPPALPGGYELTELSEHGASEQAIYQAEDKVISVILTPGVVIVNRLPAGTLIDYVDGHQVFVVPWEGQIYLVAQRGYTVVTIKGPEPLAPSMTERVDPPTPGRSLTDRVENAGKGLLQAFGLG